MENKQEICNHLLQALKNTRQCRDLESLEYGPYGLNNEIVVARFTNGGKRSINVTMDSGIAMIEDILRAVR